jgi:hypothetical protein
MEIEAIDGNQHSVAPLEWIGLVERSIREIVSILGERWVAEM